MRLNVYLPISRRSIRQAWTIFELLACIFVVCVSFETGNFVAKSFGAWAGIGAGVLSAVVAGIAVVALYRASGRRREERRRELRNKYPGIYRVLAIPTDASTIEKPEGADIKIGDYGWEAEPIGNDDLIYLQGLTEEWQVVWYAGFRPDQIESVGPKPRSQYDWNYSWVRNPPYCPFPVQKRETANMGLPMVKA